MQTWFDFDQDIIDTAIDQGRGHLRSRLILSYLIYSYVCMLVVDTLNTCSDIG